MGKYVKAVQVLQNQLLEIIFESLGLNRSYLHEEINGGSQTLAVNCYPACPQPGLTLIRYPPSLRLRICNGAAPRTKNVFCSVLACFV